MTKRTIPIIAYEAPDASEICFYQEQSFAASNTLPDMDPEIIYDEDF